MPTISSPGIGSGLDIPSIVNDLVALERRPLEILQLKQEQYSAQISGYGFLVSAVSGFQASMDSLSSLSALDIYKTSSGNPDVVDITATDSPDLGSFDVEVTRLADFHKMASAALAATDTFGGAAGDEFSIQVGAAPADTITVDLSTAKTLAEIRDAINDDEANPGVRATVINGDGGVQKLVLTAEDSGQDNALTLAYGGAIAPATFGFTTLNDIGGDTSLLDAEFIVDGFTITRSSNTITDVINGVTFDLVSADPGVKHEISISQDQSAVTQLVQSFADAYNDLRSSINDLRGQLGSDSALLTMENQLSKVLNTPATGGVYSVLSEIGLSILKDGSMQLDGDVLATALEEDFTAVTTLFAAEGQGYANRMSSLASGWLADNGLIESRTDGLNANIDNNAERQVILERKLGIVEQRYLAQFSSLDVLLGQLRVTSDYLTQQLAALPGFTRTSSK